MSRRRLSPSHRKLLEQNDVGAVLNGHRSVQVSRLGTVRILKTRSSISIQSGRYASTVRYEGAIYA